MGEDGGKEQGEGKAAHCSEGGETSAAAGSYTCCTLHISGSGRCAEAGTAGGGHGVGHEHLVDAVDVALLVHHTGLLRNTNDCSHGVEHVDKEEGEEHHQHVKREHFAPLELAEDRRYRRGNVHHAVEGGESSACNNSVGSGYLPNGQHAQQGSGNDTNQYIAGHLEDKQHTGNDNADDGQQGRAVADVAQTHQRSIVIDNNAAVLQADKGYEKTDTGADGVAQVQGDGIHNPLPHLGDGEDNEDDTLKENGGEGKLPGVPHAEAHAEDKEGVQSHAGSQRKGFLGIDGHNQRTDDGGQSCGREYGVGGHALVSQGAENAGVHSQDVGHGQECGDTGYYLGSHAVDSGVEPE